MLTHSSVSEQMKPTPFVARQASVDGGVETGPTRSSTDERGAGGLASKLHDGPWYSYILGGATRTCTTSKMEVDTNLVCRNVFDMDLLPLAVHTNWPRVSLSVLLR